MHIMPLLWHCLSMISLVVLAGASDTTELPTPKTVVYGKYFSHEMDGSHNHEANTYYLYSPTGFDPTRGVKLPIMMFYHGGGFTGGSAADVNTNEIMAYLNNGFHYVSMDYRLVATKYYYSSLDVEEEFIHVNSSGYLWVDTQGILMSDYNIQVGRQEYNTKCSYDAVQGLEHLIANADIFGIDMHSLSFSGGSAGGGEINYLTYVYHQKHTDRYTPKSMVYTMAQLDYPVQNILDRVWRLWGDDIGRDSKLSKILANTADNCNMIIGNPWCESNPQNQVNLCNQTWHDQQRTKFCGKSGENFDRVTIGDLIEGTVWPMTSEHNKGLAVLWYTSLNMLNYSPKPFSIYIANQLNSTAGMNVVHNALYARNYAKYANQAQVKYTVYYTDYEGMQANDTGTERYAVGATVWNYRSSVTDSKLPPGVARVSLAEQVLFVCHAHNMTCSVPPPSPAPPPPPPPSPSPVSHECQLEIKLDCGDCKEAQQCCEQCVRTHSADLLAHACPSAKHGGFESCVQYCTHLNNTRFDV
eukprot:m.143864 g.143864  ORF g.143864 m.143864 type:complete len:527 (+) comp30340_c0_seq3:335-1915(+)